MQLNTGKGKLHYTHLPEHRQGAHLPSFGHEPVDGYTTKTVMHGECDSRSTVTFPAAGCDRSMARTKLYCSATEAHRCK